MRYIHYLSDCFRLVGIPWWVEVLSYLALVATFIGLALIYLPSGRFQPAPHPDADESCGCLPWIGGWMLPTLSLMLPAAVLLAIFAPSRPVIIRLQDSNSRRAPLAVPDKYAACREIDALPLVQRAVNLLGRDARDWATPSTAAMRRIRCAVLMALSEPAATVDGAKHESPAAVPQWIRESIEISVVRGLVATNRCKWVGVDASTRQQDRGWDAAERVFRSSGIEVNVRFADQVPRVEMIWGCHAERGKVRWTCLVRNPRPSDKAIVEFELSQPTGDRSQVAQIDVPAGKRRAVIHVEKDFDTSKPVRVSRAADGLAFDLSPATGAMTYKLFVPPSWGRNSELFPALQMVWERHLRAGGDLRAVLESRGMAIPSLVQSELSVGQPGLLLNDRGAFVLLGCSDSEIPSRANSPVFSGAFAYRIRSRDRSVDSWIALDIPVESGQKIFEAVAGAGATATPTTSSIPEGRFRDPRVADAAVMEFIRGGSSSLLAIWLAPKPYFLSAAPMEADPTKVRAFLTTLVEAANDRSPDLESAAVDAHSNLSGYCLLDANELNELHWESNRWALSAGAFMVVLYLAALYIHLKVRRKSWPLKSVS